MKKIVIILLSVLTGCSVMAASHKHKKKQQGNEITAIKLFRTGCFGHCPTYSIEIDKNGTAIYNAVRFNKDSGSFIKKIGVAKAMEVINEANKYRVDTCKEAYPNMIPDLPGINFTVKFAGKTKNIINAKYGPAFLSDLAGLIEEAGLKTNDEGWKRITDAADKK
jgi:hypothetical protein